jgi:hypothetical protein
LGTRAAASVAPLLHGDEEPQARPQKVRKDRGGNSEPNEATSIISEAEPCGDASGGAAADQPDGCGDQE